MKDLGLVCNSVNRLLDEFEFWPDQTAYCGVSCTLVSVQFLIDLLFECDVPLLDGSLLIEASSKLLVL